MIVARSVQELENLPDGNRLMGTPPKKMTNSSIKFVGKNNILYCEDNVMLDHCSITFNASNSVIYLSSSKYLYRLITFINNDSVFYMGKDNYINLPMHVLIGEQKHCFIGNNGMISLEVWMRTSDPHLIYNSETMQRINPTKSIYVGDHVWLGQAALLLKGTQISSGSIVGARSVVSNKKIPSNTSGAGNPYKQLATGIFWSNECVNEWREEETRLSQDYTQLVVNTKIKPNDYIYKYNPKQYISFDEIDKALCSAKSVEERLVYLQKLSTNKDKNRFVAAPIAPLKKTFGGIFRKK